jgi:hypothetical protein
MGEKHALPRDKKMRKSEQDKHGQAMEEKHKLPRDQRTRQSEQDKHG